MIHNVTASRLQRKRLHGRGEHAVAIVESGIRFVQVPPSHEEESLGHAVAVGLSASQKTLPSRFFYDIAGSQLFEHITRLPEYYLTRCETEILERYPGE